jgi:hypothetical protein
VLLLQKSQVAVFLIMKHEQGHNSLLDKLRTTNVGPENVMSDRQGKNSAAEKKLCAAESPRFFEGLMPPNGAGVLCIQLVACS